MGIGAELGQYTVYFANTIQKNSEDSMSESLNAPSGYASGLN